ncbi:MAG TPA: TonB-dependent receptor, partial [Lentimicrobium sp.]|nr:TonB-dependent receptor [Lentimicrobium sp.]
FVELLGDENPYFYEYYNTLTDYGEVNSYRMKAYHRLDLAIQFHKTKPRYKRTWELGIYNAYNRKNPFFYFIENEYNESGTISKLKQVSIFPLIPSVSFNVKF